MAADPTNQSKVDTLVKAVVDHFTNEEVSNGSLMHLVKVISYI